MRTPLLFSLKHQACQSVHLVDVQNGQIYIFYAIELK